MIKKTPLAILLAFITVNGIAADVSKAAIKNIETRLGEGQVESVTKTPYAGLFEVKTKHEIMYTDIDGKYVIYGKVMDVKSGSDLTEARMNELNKIDFKLLPLDLAIKYTKGNGKRVMAIFEDPNCGYCKVLRKTLQAVDNVTIYTYQLNILSPESKSKSRDIWCSSDKSKAWDDWMLSGKVPEKAASDCTAPSDQVAELGKKYRINGTPAIVFMDGSRIPGAVSVDKIEAKFSSLQ